MGHLSKKEAFGSPPTFLECFPKNMAKDETDKNFLIKKGENIPEY